MWGYNGIMEAYTVLLGKLREKDNFEDTDSNRRIIFFIRRLTSFVESFGLLNDVFPFHSMLYTSCPVFNIQLVDILYDIDRRIILKLISMKYNETAWAGFICVGTGTSSGSCDHRNEALDSIQCTKFLVWLRNC
jgi:hypothetical protein